MKILHCLAQLPMKTGSGVYFSTLIEGMIKKGHENAVLYGTQLPFAEKTFNQSLPDKLQGSVKEYPIKFLSDYVQEEKTVFNEDIPFPIAGMSDIMPYTSTVYSEMNDEMYQKWISVFEKTLLRAKEEFNPDVIISHHLFILTSLVKKINTSGIIEFVKLPRIYDVDKAYEEDKPAFVEALAEKIMLQMERLKSQKDFYSPVAEEIKKHSWDSIIDRVEEEIKGAFSY